jgi:phage repressor protein C with HTH and peptisase S24 domain
MTTLIERLKTIMELRGMNQRSTALSAGLSADAIRKILEGNTVSPRVENLSKIAKALKANLQWLSTGEGEISSIDDVITPLKPLIRENTYPHINATLPLLGVAISANIDEFTVNIYPTRSVSCPQELHHVKEAYAIDIQGVSMKPRLFPGNYVCVNPELKPHKGDLVVVQYDENGTHLGMVKEFVSDTTDQVVVKQYNPEKEITITKKQLHSIGCVVSIVVKPT